MDCGEMDKSTHLSLAQQSPAHEGNHGGTPSQVQVDKLNDKLKSLFFNGNFRKSYKQLR
jgi:hypothetical protein